MPLRLALPLPLLLLACSSRRTRFADGGVVVDASPLAGEASLRFDGRASMTTPSKMRFCGNALPAILNGGRASRTRESGSARCKDASGGEADLRVRRAPWVPIAADVPKLSYYSYMLELLVYESASLCTACYSRGD